MASQAQITANQANALHSTGPQTPDGKRRASLNALRHGLTAQTVVLPDEDMAAYRELGRKFIAELQPATAIEEQIALRLVDLQWRLNRCAALEHAVYALGHFESPGEVKAADSQLHATMTAVRVLREQSEALKTLGLHEQRIERMYVSQLALLKSLQAERKVQEARQMSDAALVRKYKEKREEGWEPADDGFVFSLAQIDTYIARRDHVTTAFQDSVHTRH